MKLPRTLPVRYIDCSVGAKSLSLPEKIAVGFLGMILAPLYWVGAHRYKVPGLKFRKYFFGLGLRVALRKLDLAVAYQMLVAPIDSVRYFEYDFVWEGVVGREIGSYLDVSSPRLFPLMVADKNPGVVVDLLNPDIRDLDLTGAYAKAIGLDKRCRYHLCNIEDAPLIPETFNLITSISVFEHIENDRSALEKIWSLLKPGGRLLITLPCASSAYEEHMNGDDYALKRVQNGEFVFFQRFYDQVLLEERLFKITGKPARVRVFREKTKGTYQDYEKRKRSCSYFPYWRAPLDVGLMYEEFEGQLASLPGIGIVGLEFIKPLADMR